VKAYVTRFSRSERTFHWVNATFFVYLLGTGLILFLPRLSRLVGRRPLMKDLHFWGGLGWIAALALIALLGDTRGLWRTMRELETLDHRRFNPGQKVNAILNAAITVLFVITGLLLWLGERDTRFRLQNTVTLHDTLMYAALALLAGHLYLAVIHPTTRHALRGMTRGTVSEEWARRHHPRWEVPPDDPGEGTAPTPTTDAART
jgi:formate dehydrogenase subunit gamma